MMKPAKKYKTLINATGNSDTKHKFNICKALRPLILSALNRKYAPTVTADIKSMLINPLK